MKKDGCEIEGAVCLTFREDLYKLAENTFCNM